MPEPIFPLSSIKPIRQIIGFLFINLLLINCSSSPDSLNQQEVYQAFLMEYRRENWTAAQAHIDQLLRKNPNQGLYQFFKARCLAGLGDSHGAADILKECGLTWFLDNNAALKIPRFQGALIFQAALIDDLKTDSPNRYEEYYQLLRQWSAPLAQGSEDEKELFRYLSRQNPEVYHAAAKYWVTANSKKRDSAQSLKCTMICFSRLKTSWISPEGNMLDINNQLTPNQILAAKEAFQVFKKIIFYFTDGMILPQLAIIKVPGVLSQFHSRKWVGKDNQGHVQEEKTFYSYEPVEAKPYPQKVLEDQMDTTDIFLFLAPTDGLPYVSFAHRGRILINPHDTYGEIRGQITLGSHAASRPIAYLHEFFHILEAAYDDIHPFTRHLFEKTYQESWPDWYQGEGELFYYQQIIRNTIRPLSFDRLFAINNSFP